MIYWSNNVAEMPPFLYVIIVPRVQKNKKTRHAFYFWQRSPHITTTHTCSCRDSLRLLTINACRGSSAHLVRDSKPALASQALPILEEEEGERQHRHGEKGQERRRPLVAQLVVHLQAEEGKSGCELLESVAQRQPEL